jgi:hypothetical protein
VNWAIPMVVRIFPVMIAGCAHVPEGGPKMQFQKVSGRSLKGDGPFHFTGSFHEVIGGGFEGGGKFTQAAQ